MKAMQETSPAPDQNLSRPPIPDILDWMPTVVHEAIAVALSLTFFVIFFVLRGLTVGTGLIWRNTVLRHLINHSRYFALIVGYVLLFTGAWSWNLSITWGGALGSAVASLVALGMITAAVRANPKKGKLHIPPFFDKWMRDRLHNPRDVYYVGLIIFSSLVLAPAWVAVLLPQTFCIFTAVTLYILVFLMGGQQESILHSNVHNHFFRPKHLRKPKERAVFWLLNFYVEFALPLYSCRAPLRYQVDHAMMHHVEDNGIHDIQSTIWYDRKSFIDFSKFGLRRALDLSFWVDSHRYFRARGMVKPIRTLYYSQAIWYTFLVLLFISNHSLALLAFTIPILGGVAAATSIYFWHGLVDIGDLDNVYKNTINVALGPGAVHAWHLEHHLHPGRHWSTQRADAESDKSNYEHECSIVYVADDALRYLFLKAMWTRRFDLLVRLCIPTCEVQRNPVTFAKIIEERTQAVNPVVRSRLFQQIDYELGKIVSAYLLPGQFPSASRATAT